MDEEKRKKLVERRKREQEEKELQVDLHRDLKLEDKKNEQDELRGQFENKYVEMAIIFLGTLLPLYIAFFMIEYVASAFIGPVMSAFGISIYGADIVIHILIWTAAIYSGYRRRSVLEDLIDLFY